MYSAGKVVTRSQSLTEDNSNTQEHKQDKMTRNKKNTEFVDTNLNVEDKLDKILREIDTTNKGIGSLNMKFDNLFKDFQGIDRKVTEHQERIADLNKKTDSLEQYTKRNNLRIFGLAEIDREITREIICKLVNEKLEINLNDDQIEKAYRIGIPRGGETRTIFVKFTTYEMKNRVYQAKKRLRGAKVTIREDLTKVRLEVLKRAIGKYGSKNVWTHDGKIMWSQNNRKFTATQLNHIDGREDSEGPNA